MGEKRNLENPQPGSLNTLAQNGTTSNRSLGVIVQGNGSDILNTKAMKSRAKRKLITQATVLKLIDISKGVNSEALKKSYWNTYHCHNKLIAVNGKVYGKYCKNRYCTLCSANRKADILNRYGPEIGTWSKPYFMTLTVKSVPYYRLRPVIVAMIKEFRKIISKYRKQSTRGKGIKLIGIRTLESNYNPLRKTYNPHFHIITKDMQTAEILKSEWLSRAKPGWAAHWSQDIRPVKNNIASLIETVKYASKTFTQPDMNKTFKGKGLPKIYIRALHNIFVAMKGLRIFERFGFNLPCRNEKYSHVSIINAYEEWEYDLGESDWINPEGKKLTAFSSLQHLVELLNNRMDTDLE